jgi:hypothetical protein
MEVEVKITGYRCLTELAFEVQVANICHRPLSREQGTLQQVTRSEWLAEVGPSHRSRRMSRLATRRRLQSSFVACTLRSRTAGKILARPPQELPKDSKKNVHITKRASTSQRSVQCGQARSSARKNER